MSIFFNWISATLRRLEKATIGRFAVYLLLCYVLIGLGIRWPLSDTDRLSGHVKSIEWKSVTVDWKNGRFEESDGWLIKTAEYDDRGRQMKATIGNVCVDRCATLVRYAGLMFWPLMLHLEPPVRATYDATGRPVQFEKVGRPNWIYRYEYDAHGNWIKQTKLMRDLSFEGYSSFAPREIEYRNISYWR